MCKIREILIERLREDLIGPREEDEILTAYPSDVYLTGILWPRESRMGAEEDERLGLSGADESETNAGGEAEEISLTGLNRPCSAGLSFAAHAPESNAKIDISVYFATYEPVEADESEVKHDSESANLPKKQTEWHRHAHNISINGVELHAEPRHIDLEPFGAPPDTKLYLRTASWTDGTLATITLLNLARPGKGAGRKGVEQLTLFQARIEIRPNQGTILVARPSRRAILDEDDRSVELLYRNAREFANGHTCSAEWKIGSHPATASMVATSWIPTAKVPATSTAGHEAFNSLRTNNNKDKPLSARWLATVESKKLAKALQRLPAAYKTWLKTKEIEAASLNEENREQAARNIMACRNVHERMTSGATRITEDPAMSRAFQLANLAMDLQYRWNFKGDNSATLEWRPFQLGFILLTAASVVDQQHSERQFMDLLWFPTGGGKTEAYLALIAFLAFYRRLSTHDSDKGKGVAAIMRYTLRLLTVQQFVRAASVLLACEAIRRKQIPDAKLSHHELGNIPFSIGLWVGREATPNTVKDAIEALKNSSELSTPRQLLRCPACREKLNWSGQNNRRAKAIYVRCENEKCLLFDSQNPLPVWTVDEDVYRERPTLLIGTIDKFAQIVRRKEINGLFGLDTGQPPDLILQDELHLISGPLGTIAGLYEVAIDRMFSSGSTRPKIIGSTATIRRASEQVRALFNREAVLFPPSCIDVDDSAFAVVDRIAPGRTYVGITTAGRSAKFTLQAVSASLLQSAFGGSENHSEQDPYWTLVSYFNSLPELGGALVLMQDDVNDTLRQFAKWRKEEVRQPEFIEELTSRRAQADIRDMLDRLAIKAGTPGALDVVLATNMLSVGVDIPRLGLMLVHGQPKGISEYIQATSRVGRNVPGLVVSLLNNAKARDRSHYESFPTWHETLYRDVEPTSVTPFASRARDRALHAVLTALVRHLVPGMLDKPTLDKEAIVSINELINDIVQRAKEIDPEETDVRLELEEYLDNWKLRNPKSYWTRKPDSLLQGAEQAAALEAMGRTPNAAWPTLNNMRSIEVSTPFRLAKGLKKRR